MLIVIAIGGLQNRFSLTKTTKLFFYDIFWAARTFLKSKNIYIFFISIGISFEIINIQIVYNIQNLKTKEKKNRTQILIYLKFSFLTRQYLGISYKRDQKLKEYFKLIDKRIIITFILIIEPANLKRWVRYTFWYNTEMINDQYIISLYITDLEYKIIRGDVFSRKENYNNLLL